MAANPSALFNYVLVSSEIGLAVNNRGPIVALESALITHGLPFPRNFQLAREMEACVRNEGAIPATIAVISGKIRIGLTAEELEALSQSETNIKLGVRDLTAAVFEKSSGGTTVGSTMFAASREGIEVFATGGIGGVHREDSFDISADLRTLATTSMIVICAGAKAILDLPATLEYLETMGVPVIGYGTENFPAFYSRECGLKTSLRLDSPEAIADYWAAHRSLGMDTALLVANPIPEESAIPRAEMEPFIAQASREAQIQGIRGKAVTPFLLARVSELSDTRSMLANEALLLNNARLAAKIATAVARNR